MSALLSICIPTYNRAPFLRETLKTITRQQAFTDTNEVEVVISDNASQDETPAVGAEFAAAFPGKIRYHRQAETIAADLNFAAVMSLASGSYLKLHNDDLMVGNGALTEMLTLIDAMSKEKPIIFFTNGQMSRDAQVEAVNSLDDFVQRVSYIATWIGGFGIWRQDFQALPDITRNAHLRLVQTDILFRLLSLGKRAIVAFDTYFFRLPMDKKGGFNVAEVFGKNYLELLQQFVRSGALSETAFREEKKNVFLKHTFSLYFDSESAYDKTGFFVHMQDYLHEEYFQDAIEKILFLGFDAGRKIKREALSKETPTTDQDGAEVF